MLGILIVWLKDYHYLINFSFVIVAEFITIIFEHIFLPDIMTLGGDNTTNLKLTDNNGGGNNNGGNPVNSSAFMQGL